MRAELAELALGLFIERGYERTTVEDIAADLLTAAAGAALDAAAREWLRSDGSADRAALIDQASTLLAPRL